MQRRVHRAIGAALAAGLALAIASPAALAALNSSADWRPQRPIQFIISTSPGGGSDILSRMWIGIANQLELSPVPLTPTNMPGGAGAVAITYMLQQRGDPHFVTVSLNSLVTTPLQRKLPVHFPSVDLTPIAGMVSDPFVLWVNPEVITSFEDFKAQCQERELIAVGTGARQEDQVQVNLFQDALPQCQHFRFVPQPGGGDVASKIAGKHGDFSFNQTSEGLPHYPQHMIPIMTFAKTPHPTFPDVPTVWELNDDFTPAEAKSLSVEYGLHQVRGVVGPGCIPDEAVKWYGDFFEAIYNSDKWHAFMKKAGMNPLFTGPDAYKAKFESMEKSYSSMIKKLGWGLRDDFIPLAQYEASHGCSS